MNADVAQLVERGPSKSNAVGSSLTIRFLVLILFWLDSIMVITLDCKSNYGSSILPPTFFS